MCMYVHPHLKNIFHTDKIIGNLVLSALCHLEFYLVCQLSLSDGSGLFQNAVNDIIQRLFQSGMPHRFSLKQRNIIHAP